MSVARFASKRAPSTTRTSLPSTHFVRSGQATLESTSCGRSRRGYRTLGAPTASAEEAVHAARASGERARG